jgi:hypothetical protein
MRVAVPFHRFPEEFQCRFAIAALCNEAFQKLASMINRTPLIFTKTSSKCHCQFEYARIRLTRFRRISAANIKPNLFHQYRSVSWLMPMPGSCIRSSTFRSERGKRTHTTTVRRMISGPL